MLQVLLTYYFCKGINLIYCARMVLLGFHIKIQNFLVHFRNRIVELAQFGFMAFR